MMPMPVLSMPWRVRKISARDRVEIERLLDQAGKIELKVRRAFLEAIDRLQGSVDTARIAALIREGRVADAIEVVSAQSVAMGMRAVAQAITQGVIATALATSTAIPVPTQFAVVFDVTNPRTIDYLRSYEMNLIRELTVKARGAIRQAVLDGVSSGRNPLDVARDVRAHIGLTERQARAVMNYRRALETGDSAALQRAIRDRRFDASVASAIRGDSELSGEQIDRMVARYEARYLKHRSETIARTESIRAANAGNTEAWRQAASDGIVEAETIVRHWVYTHDDRTRDAHRAIPEMNPDGVGLDEPFKSPLGPIMMPGDPNASPENTINCRCTTIIRYRPRTDEEDERS